MQIVRVVKHSLLDETHELLWIFSALPMTHNDKNEDQEKTTNQLSQNLQRMSGTYTDNLAGRKILQILMVPFNLFLNTMRQFILLQTHAQFVVDIRDEQGCKATNELCYKFNLTKHFQCRNLRATKKTHAQGAAQCWIRPTCLTKMRCQRSTFPSPTI